MKELKDIVELKAENKELRAAWGELVERDDAKAIIIKQFQAKLKAYDSFLSSANNDVSRLSEYADGLEDENKELKDLIKCALPHVKELTLAGDMECALDPELKKLTKQALEDGE